MKTNTIQLKQIRKNHYLQLSDVAFLLEMDVGNLSRYESGQLLPNMKIQLGYHLLFDAPFAQASQYNFSEFVERLKARCEELLDSLLNYQQTKKRVYRIKSLQAIITRLSLGEDDE